ncbi:hypothetical protein N665_0077s0018 [Sinapis alba]|nr:hypothetical protein N665_0077s0018 [Sinapis alba]
MSSDDETLSGFDLREQLMRRLESNLYQIVSPTKRRDVALVTRSTDEPNLCDQLNATRTRESESSKPPSIDLREKLNAKADDQRFTLNRRKASNLRRNLEKSKKFGNLKQSAMQECAGTSNDLRTKIESKKAQQPPQLNVIMGGSSHCGDFVRAVKDNRRQAATSQKWPMKSENDPYIIFLAEDTIGVHSPHNDPLLIELGIGRCDVTKVLLDTGSSADLIFHDTLDKMGIDLCNMKPSTRSLTGFNGSSETMLGTIHLPIYACGFAHTTLCGDQQAAQDLLIATVKLQQATAHINMIAKPIKHIYPQKDEFVEVPIDKADPSKMVRVGAHLTIEMQTNIVNFLRMNASTFAWTTVYMKGIDPTIISHELNVDPTYKHIRQKRWKLGPEQSKAVNDEFKRILTVGSITKVKYPEWLANPVIVKKKNGKWRVCVDFTDLNKACPKE